MCEFLTTYTAGDFCVDGTGPNLFWPDLIGRDATRQVLGKWVGGWSANQCYVFAYILSGFSRGLMTMLMEKSLGWVAKRCCYPTRTFMTWLGCSDSVTRPRKTSGPETRLSKTRLSVRLSVPVCLRNSYIREKTWRNATLLVRSTGWYKQGSLRFKTRGNPK